MERVPVTVYTDGSCKGNPGPGGWGAILVRDGKEEVIRGGSKNTTNNRMELMAVIEAISECKQPSDIYIYTDSTYVVMTKEKWVRYSKKQSKTQSVKNWDLWDALFKRTVTGKHMLHYRHIAGHSGHAMNERCDRIAKEQACKYSHAAAGTNTLTINEAVKILAGRC